MLCAGSTGQRGVRFGILLGTWEVKSRCLVVSWGLQALPTRGWEAVEQEGTPAPGARFRGSALEPEGSLQMWGGA